MNSEELFRRLLGLEDPWIVKEIRFDHQEKRVDIFMDFLGGSGFSLHFEALIVEMGREMPVSAVAMIVEINEDSVWRILKHYVDEARKDQDPGNISPIPQTFSITSISSR